jgi:hypothetical protein
LGLGVSLLVLGFVVVATAFPATIGTPGGRLRAQFDRVHRAVAVAFRTTPPEPLKVKPTPRLVDIQILADSPGAKLYLDGREISNPLKVAYPADDILHEIRVEVSGREPRIHRAKLDRDMSVVFGM